MIDFIHGLPPLVQVLVFFYFGANINIVVLARLQSHLDFDDCRNYDGGYVVSEVFEYLGVCVILLMAAVPLVVVEHLRRKRR